MRIAILNITGGGMSGGHKKYLLNILPLLAGVPEVEAVLCASPAAVMDEVQFPELQKVEYSRCEAFRPFIHSPGPLLRSALDGFRPDMLFIPIERYISYQGLPVVIMVQNMAPLSGHNTGYGPRERLVGFLRKYESRVAVSKAVSIIAPTEHVKRFLAESLNVPAAKIAVVGYGADVHLPAPKVPHGYPFPGKPFLLTAGSIERYRGLEDAIRALPRIRQRFGDVKLAVAGAPRPSTERYLTEMKSIAADLGVGHDVVWLGALPPDELAWCYSNCSAMLLTSRIESFCFVALEALAHGCNCVSASSPCLPEVLGDAAVYYSPGDVPGLEQAIGVVLSKGDVARETAATAARLRASSFSWKNTARATLQILSRSTRKA